jgi:ribosomal protein S18 acetylase RimI-like enzyme
MRIRDVRPEDLEFWREMSLEAMSWRGAGDPADIPAMAVYLRPWGRSGDTGLIAEAENRLGAAWYRFYTAFEPGYGFVSEDVPEIGIAVGKAHRGRGVGRKLMDELIARARSARLRGLSLSVEDGNEAAARLYAATGFARVHRNGNAWTMVLWLR